MRIPFTKMHGLGNDFMVVRGAGLAPPAEALIRSLADRRRGVGFDQLLWLGAPRSTGADVSYRIYNADGSVAGQCGNGARCIARLVGGNDRAEVVLEHDGGLARARLEPGGDVSVEMGQPDFDPASVPFVTDQRQESYAVIVNGEPVNLHVVSIGNPHAVVQVDDVEAAPVARLGPLLEHHARFPNRANIGFMQVVASDCIRLRVFERGAGETEACGTGACAAAVVGRETGQLSDRVRVELPGGTVAVRWDGPGQPVWLTGEAITVYEGTIEA